VVLSSTQAEAAKDLQARLSEIERLLSADPALAEQRASEFLAKVPGHVMALLFQGIARRLAGNTLSAIEVLRPLSVTCPDAPFVHLQLGLALREAGQREAAVESIRRAVAVKPDFSDAWLALADLLTAMGEKQGADAAFTEYVGHSTGDPVLRQAATALRNNRIAEADTLLRKQLATHPNDVVVLFMLADVAERLDRMVEAESLLKRCLDLAPSYTRARQNYAVALLRQNKVAAALEETNSLLSKEPSNPEFRKLRASILVQLREYDESIELCEELLNQEPDQPTVWTSLGHMLKTVGRREDCIKAYRKAIALAPHFGEPYWSLINLKTLKVSDAELQSMQSQLDNPVLTDPDRIHFYFAIGRALEDRAQFEDSFRHFHEGNRLRRNNKPYNPEELTNHLRRSERLFTPGFFAARKNCGAPEADPIFIVGLPRSGSTLVEQILASHSEVEGTMELQDLAILAKSLNARNAGAGEPVYPEILAGMDIGEYRELGNAYIEQTRIQRKLDKPFFIDKAPNNFAHVGLIHLILPNARIIDVRRHPLACGLSLYKEHFARGQNFSYDLEDIGRYYRDYVEMMENFDRVMPGRVHRVIYEVLVDDTETEVRRLLEYCGLPFEHACLDFHKNRRAVSTASAEQVRAPIFRAAIDHWRHYEPWLGPLKAVLGSLPDSYRL